MWHGKTTDCGNSSLIIPESHISIRLTHFKLDSLLLSYSLSDLPESKPAILPNWLSCSSHLCVINVPQGSQTENHRASHLVPWCPLQMRELRPQKGKEGRVTHTSSVAKPGLRLHLLTEDPSTSSSHLLTSAVFFPRVVLCLGSLGHLQWPLMGPSLADHSFLSSSWPPLSVF